MKSPVYPLYESAYCFDSADPKLSAVDLIPTEWNRFTVTDGKAFTDETLEALKWRDVYLANTIEEVSGELSDKYIAGAGIEIDKENKTIGRVSTKFKLNCSSGLGYNENLKPKIAVIAVNKKTDLKFFQAEEGKNVANPPSDDVFLTCPVPWQV